MIVVVGLSHRTAPVQVRERVAGGGESLDGVVASLMARAEVSESLVLSTCNRVEIFATASGAPTDAIRAMRDVFGQHTPMMTGEELATHLFEYAGGEAMRHIFRVASSLDSLVVGEPQILGQLKDAYDAAVASGALGGLLGRCIERSFGVAKRVRTETALGAGSVSISSVAVDLAQRIFGELSSCAVLLVGAGEMAEAATRSLGRGARQLRVCNRSIERAEALAATVDGSVAPWEDLERELATADVVVTSTSARAFVIDNAMVKRVMRLRRGKTLFLIDIAVPRNVEPSVHAIDNVYVYNIDDLEELVAEGMKSRLSEVDAAESIVRDELAVFDAWLRERTVRPTIVALREKIRAVLEAEREKAFSGKLRHLSVEDRNAITHMLDGAANKLLHAPTTRLKSVAGASTGGDSASEFASALQYLFELHDAEAEPKPGDREAPIALSSSVAASSAWAKLIP